MAENVTVLPTQPSAKVELEVGDTVRLSCDYVLKTVSKLSGRGKDVLVSCKWHDSEGTLLMADFDPRELRFVEGSSRN